MTSKMAKLSRSARIAVWGVQKKVRKGAVFLNNFRLGLDGLGVRPLDGRVNFFRAT